MGSSYSCYTLNPSYSPFHLQRVLFVFRKPRFHSWPSIFSAFASCAAARRRFQCTFASFFATSKPKASGAILAMMCTSAQRPFCYSAFRYSVFRNSVFRVSKTSASEVSLDSRTLKVVCVVCMCVCVCVCVCACVCACLRYYDAMSCLPIVSDLKYLFLNWDRH